MNDRCFARMVAGRGSPFLGRRKRREKMLPVLVPPQFNHVNMERGQRYFFKIEVGEKGILRAQDVKKV